MTRRILLIDADPDFRATLTQQLARYRFDLMVEPDADDASAAAARATIELILLAAETDKVGFKTFGKLKKGPLAKTKIILTTRSLAPEDIAKHRGMRVHADDYIDKRSIADAELLALIDRHVGLGDPVEDLDIPVEIDDIPMGNDEMVLDETVGDDDEPRTMVASPDDPRLAEETDAAFDALLGDFGEAPEPVKPEAATAEGSRISVPVIIDEEPAGRHDDDPVGGFDTFSRESMTFPKPVPASEPAIIADAVRAHSAAMAAATPSADMIESSPAIVLDPDDLVEEDSGGVPEPVPHPASQHDVEEAQEARQQPARFVDARTITETLTGVRAVVDLGLDAIADAEPVAGTNEQSGVYDRRSLRKIHELERQIQQLKTELDRARASAESASPRGSREREFVNLKSQVIAKDEEAKRARAELDARTRELGDLDERFKQAQQARIALETKTNELEQQLASDGSRASTLESRERTLTAQVASLQQDLEHRTQALATAESARSQFERDLTTANASRAATASEAERALRVEREQMIARHQGEMGGLRMEHAGAMAIALEKARQEHETVTTTIRKENDAALEVARQQVDVLRQQHASELDTVRQQAATAAETARSEHASAALAMRRQHEGVVETAQQEHAAALAAAQSEHLGVLAAIRQEHAGLLVSAQHELAAAVEATRQEVAGEADRAVSTLEAQHTADVARLREEHAGAIGERDTRIAHLETEHATAQEQYAETLARVQEQHAGEAAALAASHDRAVAELRGDRDRAKTELANVQAAHDRARAQLLADHAGELEQQANQHAEAMLAREHEWAQQRRDEAVASTTALAELKAELEKQAAAHGLTLDTVKKELDDVVALNEQAKHQLAADHRRHADEQAAAHAAELAAITEERQSAIDEAARAQAEHRTAFDRATAQHRDELAQLKDTGDRETAEYRSALVTAKRALEETTTRMQAERDALVKEHDKAVADLRALHERAIAVANGEIVKVKAVGDAEHNRAMAAKEAEHDKQRKELATERDDLQRGLSAARDTLKRSETELAAAVQTIADRNQELRVHAAAITERDQRIADLRKEIETLETENTSYQEQVLRAYQKIKSDEAKSARAKKAMAIALTALDEEAAKTESS